MYGLVALLSIGVLAAAWRVFEGERNRMGEREKRRREERSPIPPLAHSLFPSSLSAYIIFATAASLYPILRHFPAHWIDALRVLVLAARRVRLMRWLAAQIVVAVLYLPWVIYAAPKLVPYVSQKVVQDADKPLGPLMYTARHLAAFTAGHLEGPLASWWPGSFAVAGAVVSRLGRCSASERESGRMGEK